MKTKQDGLTDWINVGVWDSPQEGGGSGIGSGSGDINKSEFTGP